MCFLCEELLFYVLFSLKALYKYGLCLYVHTRDMYLAFRVAEKICIPRVVEMSLMSLVELSCKIC